MSSLARADRAPFAASMAGPAPRGADLYLVAGDPLKDIGDIRKGRLVVKDGALLFPDEMLAVLEIKALAARAEVHNAGPEGQACR